MVATSPSPVRSLWAAARGLADVAQTLDSTQNPTERLTHALSVLEQLVPYDCAALLEAEPSGGYRLLAEPALSDEALAALSQVLRRRTRLLSEGADIAPSEHWPEPSEHIPWRSYLAVPLVGADRVVGLLFAGRAAADAFEEHDLSVLTVAGAQIAAYLTILRLQRAREDEWERLRQVVEVLPQAVVVVDARGRAVLLNEAARRFWADGGATGGELHMLEAPRWHLDGSAYTEDELPLARAVRGGEVVRGEQLLLADQASGSRVPVLVNSAPLHDASGALAGAVAVYEDISPIKALERQKDEFMASVSHDLKSPLAALRARAQLLRRDLRRSTVPSPDRLHDGLLQIEDTAVKMGMLLEELLDVSRIHMGQPLALHRAPADLVAIVRRVVAEQERTRDSHVVWVDCERAEIVGHWDAGRIERVVDNVVGNALKYNRDDGEVLVTIGYGLYGDGVCALLQVTDRGVGIPAADLARAFERFHRGENVAGRVAGTGLGLAGAKQIVEEHGGEIAIESEEGVGTTVTVRLPL